MRFRRTTSPDDHGILIDNTDIRVLEHVEVLDRESQERGCLQEATASSDPIRAKCPT